MNRLVTNDKSQVQVIARAATILRALEEENSGLSLGQIAQRVNLARSTVQRIVAALETEKLVIAATPNGRVRLGPTILRLAASVRSDFVAMARPFLERLSEELHETVDLSTVKKDHLVFIDQVIGSQRLRTVSAVGETFPLTCTANGKAYLAELDDDAIEALIGRSYKARTPHTITRLPQLLDDIRAVRRNGYALDREEPVRLNAEAVACEVGALVYHSLAHEELLTPIAGVQGPVPTVARSVVEKIGTD